MKTIRGTYTQEQCDKLLDDIERIQSDLGAVTSKLWDCHQSEWLGGDSTRCPAPTTYEVRAALHATHMALETAELAVLKHMTAGCPPPVITTGTKLKK